MLFDLRSRRRRTAVRIIYVFLALLMGGGLVLVGVGTGNGNGGLLNAFSNNGSTTSNTNDPLIKKELATAIRQTQQNPDSPAAWSGLMQARLEEAQSGGNYDSTSNTYKPAGQAALRQGLTAWKQYLKATGGKPQLTGAELAKTLYAGVGDYTGVAAAYQDIVKLEPKLAGAYTCLAYSAYAAGSKSLGDLAAAKAVKLSPKLQKLTLQSSFKASAKTPATAKAYVTEEC